MSNVLGMRHVTAIASDPKRNLDSYGGVLGLRLVKRMVHFDAPQGYHFYFGDEAATRWIAHCLAAQGGGEGDASARARCRHGS